MGQETTQDLILRAEIAYKSRKYAESANLFESALREYSTAGDPIKAAEMSNNRSVALLQAGDPQGAFDAAAGTDTVFALSGDVRRQAMAIGNQAAALEGLNRLDEALQRFKQCSELLKQMGEEEYRPLVLKSISTLQLRTGHQLEALASMDAALGQQKKLGVKERLLKKLLHIPFTMLKRG